MPEISRAVLVVDDEEIDARMIRRALNRAGYRVLVASSFETAVAAFEKNPAAIGAAIIDVSLPGKDGVELSNRLLEQRPDLPVLFVSGWAGAEVLRASSIPELDRRFLPKPFRPADLIARVEELTAEREAAGGAGGA